MKIPSKNAWVTFADSSEIVKGGVISGFSFGQELAIACTKNGQLYAMANKLPPTGQPATLGKVTDDGKAIVEPLCGTAFDLKTGKPVGKWCPYPLGQLVFGRLIGPSDVAVFKVRQQGGKVQVRHGTTNKAAALYPVANALTRACRVCRLSVPDQREREGPVRAELLAWRPRLAGQG